MVPLIRARLNQQFLLGARNQAFVTEYIAGIETVKSLQMEPQLKTRYGDYLAAYLGAGFDTRQLSNTYNVAANALEQLMTLLILVRRRLDRDAERRLHHRHAGRVPDVRRRGCRSRCCGWSACGRSSSRRRSRSSAWATS